MGEHAELLPRAIGAVVIGGHYIERELALQLCERLLLRPAPAHEREERRRGRRWRRRRDVAAQLRHQRGSALPCSRPDAAGSTASRRALRSWLRRDTSPAGGAGGPSRRRFGPPSQPRPRLVREA